MTATGLGLDALSGHRLGSDGCGLVGMIYSGPAYK